MLSALYIAGPTAAGKSDIAIEIALRCNGEIIGADAFQVYRGLDILTAKPSPADRSRVPHHLVDCVPLSQPFDVAQYLDAASKCADEIRARGRLPIFCGGTGLYLRAVTRGLSDLPKADATIRAELDATPLETLQARYIALDPAGAALIDMKNKRRLVRAIEVSLITGEPFSAFRDTWKNAAPPDGAIGFLLTRDRDDLYSRIDRRVQEMFRDGVVDEVRATIAAGAIDEIGPTAAQAIGFREIRGLLDGTITEPECIARVQQATRRYAKRQLTWFRSEPTLFQPVNLSLHTNTEPIIQMIGQHATSAVARRDV